MDKQERVFSKLTSPEKVLTIEHVSKGQIYNIIHNAKVKRYQYFKAINGHGLQHLLQVIFIWETL